MLRIIERPIVYFAGPEVFNTTRDDQAIAEERGNKQLKKLGADGIVKKSYQCMASMRLPGAEKLEESDICIDTITEDEYTRFLTGVPVRERKAMEEKLCEEAGVEPLDILIAPGGRLNKLRIDDTRVFRKKGNPFRLLEDMHPEIKQALEQEARKQAISVRFYVRRECLEKMAYKVPQLIKSFKEHIAALTFAA
jgi:hypothetical protein